MFVEPLSGLRLLGLAGEYLLLPAPCAKDPELLNPKFLNSQTLSKIRAKIAQCKFLTSRLPVNPAHPKTWNPYSTQVQQDSSLCSDSEFCTSKTVKGLILALAIFPSGTLQEESVHVHALQVFSPKRRL